jgi:hypothetical protein
VSSGGKWLQVEHREEKRNAEFENKEKRRNEEDYYEGEEEGTKEQGELEEKADLAGANMLLGSVTFVMSLFYLVNHSDHDIRKYAWRVISQTISIFVAVLVFVAFVGVLEASVDHCIFTPMNFATDLRRVARCMVAYAEFLVLYCSMHIILAHYAHKRPGVAVEGSSTHIKTERDQRQFEQQRRLDMRAWGTLAAHTCGFALIRCTETLQHVNGFVRSSPSMAMAPVLVNTLLLIGLFRLADWIRSRHSESGAACDLWDEEADDAENDVAQLALSFPTVVALRFAITGQLANLEGIEVPLINHSMVSIGILFGAGLVSACLAIGTICWRFKPTLASIPTRDAISNPYESFGGLDPLDVYMRRWVYIASNVGAAVFSWCAMFATKWTLHRTLLDHGLRSHPNSCLQRVVLALVVSFGSFVLIRCLDIVRDMDSTGVQADRGVTLMIKAISILVGFSWEQSFDAGVEDISELVPEEHPIYVALFKLALAGFIAVVLIPAWRSHLLKKTLGARDKCERCVTVLVYESEFCHKCGLERPA